MLRKNSYFATTKLLYHSSLIFQKYNYKKFFVITKLIFYFRNVQSSKGRRCISKFNIKHLYFTAAKFILFSYCKNKLQASTRKQKKFFAIVTTIVIMKIHFLRKSS